MFSSTYWFDQQTSTWFKFTRSHPTAYTLISQHSDEEEEPSEVSNFICSESISTLGSVCLRVCAVFNYTCMYMQVCKYCVVCALLYSAIFLMGEILTDTVLQAFDLTHDYYLSLCTYKCHNALIFDRVNFDFLTESHPIITHQNFILYNICVCICVPVDSSACVCVCVCVCCVCVMCVHVFVHLLMSFYC